MSAEPTNGLSARQRPEIELLLCCARARIDAARAERLRQLAAGALDWDYLVALAARHGLQPLVHWHLNAVCPQAVPPTHRAALHTAFTRVSALNVFLTRELQKLLALFAAQGVVAAPYKGPALAADLYGHIALRQFGDLDILVRPSDIKRARDVLLAEGYAPYPPLTDAQQARLLRTQCNQPFTRERNRLVVELHWSVSAPRFARPFEGDGFWSRLGAGRLDGTRVHTPAAEDMLLALCVHGTKHCWERLAWVSDVAELIDQRPRLRWAQLCAAAQATGSERMLYLGVRLATDLLGASPPAEVVREVAADVATGALAATVVSRMFTPELPPSGLGGYLGFQLRARRRLRDKLNYLCFAVTPTEEDMARLALPAPLSFLYYLLRPARMIATGGPRHFH